MKIMVAVAIFVAAALFMGAASAVNVADDPTSITQSDVMTSGQSYVLNFSAAFDPTGNLTSGKSYYLNNSAIKSITSFAQLGGSGTFTVGTDAKVNLANVPEGIYMATATFADVIYDLNVTDTVTGAAGKFTVKSGHQVANITPNVPYALIYPNGKPVSVGITFTNVTGGQTYTATVDDRGYLGIVTSATPNNPNGIYTYKATGLTADFYVKVAPKGSVIGYDGYREIDASKNQTAFVYEKINVTGVTNPSPMLTLYSSGENPQVIKQISGTVVDNNIYFYLTEAAVGTNYGKYVVGNKADGSDGIVYIWYPEIGLEARLAENGAVLADSIDGKTINKNTEVSFLINSPQVASAFLNTTSAKVIDQAAYAKVIFTTPVSGKTTAFGAGDYSSIQLTGAQSPTAVTTASVDAAAGVYTAQAEYITFNLIGDRPYSVFADYAKKSNTVSFTLQSTTLTITAAKDSVVRSNPFTVTIQGDSKKEYEVFIEGMVDTDVNPALQADQSGFQEYTDYDNFGNPTGAVFKTDAAGKRTIQYNTAADTEDKTYTIRVESVIDPSDYDKVKVKVEKGSVTIAASGDGSYYIGEEIKLTGTNTDSSNVFLFITGPNLDYNDGIVLKDLGGKSGVQNAAYTAANPVSVKTDNTWEYKWDTTLVSLDAGAYTVYATSRLTNGKSSGAQNLGKVGADASTWLNSKADVYGNEVNGNYVAVKLSDSEYATTSINLKKPFLSAIPSGTIVAKGDKIYIRGTAEGDPNSLQLYIFGPNFFTTESITVEDDGSYEKKIEVGSTWASNQYYVVIEHPMENGKLDVHDTGMVNGIRSLYIDNVDGINQGQQSSFIVEGTGKLQSANAANALTTMIDSANIDDIYTKLTFTVAEPVISVMNPGDKAVGTKFTISGTTNLAIDDQILVEVVSSSFDAVDKSQSSSTSGVSQTAKVAAGEGADNTWSVEVDTTNWKLDEYTIKVQGIEVDVTSTTNFNLVEKVVTTVPTTSATTAVPTGATSVPTTTPTKTPGFGAFIALAGLGAVALLVLRRN